MSNSRLLNDNRYELFELYIFCGTIIVPSSTKNVIHTSVSFFFLKNADSSMAISSDKPEDSLSTEDTMEEKSSVVEYVSLELDIDSSFALKSLLYSSVVLK